MREFRISSSFPKLEVSELSLCYPEQDRALWEKLSFEARPGEITAITGANASGKSSLIYALSGVIPQSIKADLQGAIWLGETNLRELPLCEIYRYMSVGLSDAAMQLLLPTCELELAFALENMGLPPEKIRQRITAAAAEFKLEGLLNQDPQSLSGGEQRLLLFAICLAMQNPILLLDEPESGLSPASLNLLCSWLTRLKANAQIIILATHDEQLIQLSDQQINLDR